MIAAHPFEEAAHAVEVDGTRVCWTTTREEAQTDRDQRQRLHSGATVTVVDLADDEGEDA